VLEPNDVDVILVMAAGFRVEHSPAESRMLFSHARAQSQHGATVFWLREGMVPEAVMREFLSVWQTKRDGTLRGILEIA
jgi:hypothetical protein